MLELLASPFRSTLHYIYYNGPSWFGMWHGVPQSEICSQLTRVPADIWKQQAQACTDLLDRDFVAFSIGASIVAGLAMLWKAADAILVCTLLRRQQSIVIVKEAKSD